MTDELVIQQRAKKLPRCGACGDRCPNPRIHYVRRGPVVLHVGDCCHDDLGAINYAVGSAADDLRAQRNTAR